MLIPELVKTSATKDLSVVSHLVTLQSGLFCIYESGALDLPDPAIGLPRVRLALPSGQLPSQLSICSFHDSGWMGGGGGLPALVRVPKGAARILITIYMPQDSACARPKLEILRLASNASLSPAAVMVDVGIVNDAEHGIIPDPIKGAPRECEIKLHVQHRGDISGHIGDWVGDPGSRRWIEGFAIAPQSEVTLSEIEYQAVLGKDWLSPWKKGGEFCGSRMALPLLGLRVRLCGTAATSHTIDLAARFTDGTAVGPVSGGRVCTAPTLAPLEAFQILIRPRLRRAGKKLQIESKG